MISPLVGLQSSTPSGSPKVGDLATALLFTSKGDRPYCCRIERVDSRYAWVKVIGLAVEWPYQVGDQITVTLNKVIDWES